MTIFDLLFKSRMRADIRQILIHLCQIERKVNHFMATEQDFQSDLDAIKVLVQSQSDAIAALVAGQPVSQEQLDALDQEAKAILAIGVPVSTPAPPTAPSAS